MSHMSQQGRSRRRRKCRRALRAELPDTPQQETGSPPAPAAALTPPSVDGLKRPEIIAELDRIGADYDPRGRKADLAALLDVLLDARDPSDGDG